MKAKKPKVEWITAAELARRRNVTRAAVVHAEKQGLITKVDRKFKWPDVSEEWDSKTNVSNRAGKDKVDDEKWQEARTRREVAQADMAELELQEKLGQALDAKQVKTMIFEKCRVTRDRILATAKRVAPAVIGLTDERKVARVIYEELEKALEALRFDAATKSGTA